MTKLRPPIAEIIKQTHPELDYVIITKAGPDLIMYCMGYQNGRELILCSLPGGQRASNDDIIGLNWAQEQREPPT